MKQLQVALILVLLCLIQTSKVFQTLSPEEQEKLKSFAQEQLKKNEKIDLDLITRMQLIKQFTKPQQYVSDPDLSYDLNNKIVKLDEASLVMKGNQLILSDVFEPELENDEVVCGQVKWKEELKVKGWDQLLVKSDSRCDVGLQRWAAGFLEGYVTSYKIHYFFTNLVKQHEEDSKEYIQQVFNFYKDVEANIRQRTSKTLGLIQLHSDGLLVGYNQNHPQVMTMSDLMFMNGDGQISELIQLFKDNWMKKNRKEMFRLKTKLEQKKKAQMQGVSRLNLRHLLNRKRVNTIQELFDLTLQKGHCSALVTLNYKTDGSIDDILFSHQTWDDYSQMLRVFKHYDLNGIQTTFSSYPGCLSSTDDWYNNKGPQAHLMVTETTLEVLNDQLYNYLIGYEDYLPDFMRIMLANQLGYSGKTWAFWLEYFNTGTYNSQWLLLDLLKAKPGVNRGHLLPDTFVVMEQMPGDHNIQLQDMTQWLVDKGYFASYNIPLFTPIRQVSGYDDIVDQQQEQAAGENFSYVHNPRAIIFQNYWKKAKDIPGIKQLMQLNLFQAVPSKGFVDKIYYSNNPGHQIAARFDLVRGMPRNVGAIDVKVVDLKLALKGQQWTISGPTHQQQPTFVWSKARTFDQHLGQPDTWNFDWLIIDPAKIKTN